MAGEERLKRVDGVVDASVRSEVRLGLGEEDHRAVGAGALELARAREADGVVEGETQRLVRVFAALSIEEV